MLRILDSLSFLLPACGTFGPLFLGVGILFAVQKSDRLKGFGLALVLAGTLMTTFALTVLVMKAAPAR